MNTFVKGSLILIIASFLGECVEFITNMVLARQLGEEGLGLYMSILPTIFLIVLLTSLEMPVSISKYVAEKDAKYHRNMLEISFQITVIVTAIALVLITIIYPYVSIFDKYHPYFKWLLLMLIPFITFSAVARGYLMGKQQMGKIAIANFLRKFVQLLLLVWLFQLFSFEQDTAILIAFFSFVGSEFIIFLYLLHNLYLQYQQLKLKRYVEMHPSYVRRNLLSVSLPTTSIRVFHSLTHAIEPFLISGALIQSGMLANHATEEYGLLAGVAMTIGFFPAFIAHSLHVSLIPTVSKAKAERRKEELQNLLRKVISFTLTYGIPVAFIFYFFAEPLSSLFLQNERGPIYLQLLIPYFLFHYLAIPLQAYLIGLGLLKDTFIHNVWSTVVAFSLIYVLGSKESLQMGGVVIGMNTGAVLLALLHYVTICKKIGVSFYSLKISPSEQ